MDKRTPTHGLGPSNTLTEREALDRLGLGAREGCRWLQAHGLIHDVLGPHGSQVHVSLVVEVINT